MMHRSDLPVFALQRCDNGFILEMTIPCDYDKNAEMLNQMADKVIAAQNKIHGEDYKNEEVPLYIPGPPKTNFIYVCKDEKEVLERIHEFFKMSK